MNKFNGFPEKNTFTPIPNIFFSSLLTDITDINELKVTLYVLQMVYPKKGYPKFVTFRELLSNPAVVQSISKSENNNTEDVLRNALQAAFARGTLIGIHLIDDKSGNTEELYMLNTKANQKTLEQIQRGELKIPIFKTTEAIPAQIPEKEPEIFTLYQENIGLLTPIIAEELKEAEKIYPAGWLRDAIKEAVALNKRNWRYIQRILERWSVEGKHDGTYRRHSKENTDPDKYIKGKYGHIVQR